MQACSYVVQDCSNKSNPRIGMSSVAMVECVSRKKTKSALRFRHQRKKVLLFRKSLKPFTFIIDQSNLLCGSGIAEIRNNTHVGENSGVNERRIGSRLHIIETCLKHKI